MPQREAPTMAAATRESAMHDERFALVSVLQELTVAALELFDPRHSADGFLERLAERLGCYVTLLVRFEPHGAPVLHGASGLSPASRRERLNPELATELLVDKPTYRLPYRELSGRRLSCWRFPLLAPPGAVLLLFFEGDPLLPKRYYGMVRHLCRILDRVFEHRALFARTIESERDLEQKKTLIECLSEASPDGVLFIDSTSEIFFVNRRFVEMWAVDEAVASRSIDNVLEALAAKVVDREGYIARANEIRNSPNRYVVDEIKLRDGRVFERHARPVRNVAGVSYGYALFFRDVTERKAALETEQKARANAEEALHARDEFLSVASHELRTPVTALQLATHQLMRGVRDQSGNLPGPALRSLDTARRQTDRLVRLVDALLDVSKIRAGRLQLELEDVDLGAVVSDVVARLDHEIAASGSPLVVETSGPVEGHWDRSRLDQVVTNLISNAIKYGRGQRIEVKLSADEDDAHLEVQDHGIGIPKEQFGRLFQRFERAVSSRHYGGLGLGLFIVRQIVEAHGGSVTLESEPGVGSTFKVTLPRRGRQSTVDSRQ